MRGTVADVVRERGMSPWVFEETGAHSGGLELSYLEQVAASDFVIWLVAGTTTVPVENEVRRGMASRKSRLLVFRLPRDDEDEPTRRLMADVQRVVKYVEVDEASLAHAVRVSLDDELTRAVRSDEPPDRFLLPQADALRGREGQSDEMLAALSRDGAVAISGLGGVGKSALAIAVAHRLATVGRAFFVPLRGLHDHPADPGDSSARSCTAHSSVCGMLRDGGPRCPRASGYGSCCSWSPTSVGQAPGRSRVAGAAWLSEALSHPGSVRVQPTLQLGYRPQALTPAVNAPEMRADEPVEVVDAHAKSVGGFGPREGEPRRRRAATCNRGVTQSPLLRVGHSALGRGAAGDSLKDHPPWGADSATRPSGWMRERHACSRLDRFRDPVPPSRDSHLVDGQRHLGHPALVTCRAITRRPSTRLRKRLSSHRA